jgi:hypothetical protein
VDQLSEADEDNVAYLLEAPDSEVLELVDEYVTTDPQPGDHRVFRDPRVAGRTLWALDVLVRRAAAKIENPPKGKGRDRAWKSGWEEARDRLAAQRKVLRRISGLIVDRENAQRRDTPRQRAYEALARDYPKEFTAYRRQFEAEAAARVEQLTEEMRRIQFGP